MQKPSILVAMPVSDTFRVRLAALYTVHGPLDPAAPHGVPETARGARALLTLGSLRSDAALMDQLPELRLISCYGTGFEGVDRKEAAARGIQVTHAGDANATSVAEFAFGLLVATERKIVAADRMVRRGAWTSLGIGRMPVVPGLAGKRVGIYGLGTIGLRIARRAEAFEMAVGYHNRSRRAELPYLYHDSLLALADWADVLMVAARASAENAQAVNRTVLEALGPAGTLVNIARGSVVDEDALCAALEAGTIAGAGLDVYAHEPHVPERLRVLENAVLTPHMAALSDGAQIAQQDVLADNLAAFFAGRPLRSLVPAAG